LIMSELQSIIDRIIEFRDERDWEQFHNSKDLALAISIEASELLELFLWKENEEADPEKLKEELADDLTFCFLLAEKHGMDVKEIIDSKISQNTVKYPIYKAKGNAKKYDEL
jgi:NTP pyrophosphatase (non-canonical NTP hydrolase)